MYDSNRRSIARQSGTLSAVGLMALIANLTLIDTSLAVDTAAPEANKRVEGSMPKPDVNPITTASGLQYIDFKVGDGPSPQPGQTAIVHYTGWLDDGKKFDSSKDRGKPFGFKVAKGQVIKGWDEGVASMKVGGVRRLIIPPELGYGARGAGGGKVIPPNARLTFDVELLEIRD